MHKTHARTTFTNKEVSFHTDSYYADVQGDCNKLCIIFYYVYYILIAFIMWPVMYAEELQHFLSLPSSSFHVCLPLDVSQMYHDNLSWSAICACSQTEGFIPHQWSAARGHLCATLIELQQLHDNTKCKHIRASACMCWINECICMCVSLCMRVFERVCVCPYCDCGLTCLIHWDKGSGALMSA